MPKKLKPMDYKADLSKVRVAPTKKKKEPSEWIKLAQKTYKEGKAKNPSYQYSQALKDAGKLNKRKKFKKEAATQNLKEFRKEELKKVARAKLKRGQSIKSEAREQLKKGQAINKKV